MAKATADDSEFSRISLTIPTALKREMETLAAGENWSAWAAECFRGRIIAIKARKKGIGAVSTKEVVERLKASAEHEEQEDFDDGKRAGRMWAAKGATAGQLRRLSKANDQQQAWEGIPWGGRTWAGLVAVAIDPRINEREDRTAVESFWEAALGDDAARAEDDEQAFEPNPFLRGFIAGAVEVWDEVSGQL